MRREPVMAMDDYGIMCRQPDLERASSEGSHRIGLVGCVKLKADVPRAARELYVSALFSGRRSYVEGSCNEWWVLSAKYGLVHPDAVLSPYDATLKDASRPARCQWSERVLAMIDEQVRPAGGDAFEIHAGVEYRDFGLVDSLRSRGFAVVIPTEGMPIGEQLRFYKRARERQS